MDYFKYFRYKTANCNQYKYVRAHLREEALTMLSYLINDDGNGDPSETYLFLKNFEEIDLEKEESDKQLSLNTIGGNNYVTFVTSVTVLIFFRL